MSNYNMFMKMRKYICFFLLSVLFSVLAYPIGLVADEIVTYKKTAEKSLTLHIFYPDGQKPGSGRSAIVHFFGGGWRGGSPVQFYQQCKDLASKGMVAITADYRVMASPGITPFDCVADARDAISYIREHARELGINPEKIGASGGSAGGHVALCTAVFPDKEKKTSAVPDFLVLYNPVMDTSDKGFGKSSFKGNELDLSPYHHIRKGLPPTLICHGTADTTVPFSNATAFEKKMKQNGNICRLFAVEGEQHGFFNSVASGKTKSNRNYNLCMKEVYSFLTSLHIGLEE